MVDLPNEITMIILSNLPVKSLFLSYGVLGFHVQNLGSPINIDKEQSSRFINQQLTLEEPNYCSSDYEDNHIISCMILGSCHGLILFNLNEHIYLWNPATRFRTKVLENVNFLGGYITHGGLCYDSSKNTYKVVLIMRYMTSDGDRFVTIASLEDKHWRRLEFPYDIHTVNYYGITLHERLHYYVPDVKNVEDDNDENSDEDDGNKKGIWDRLPDSPRKLIYLDPITEKLHMFPTPEPKNNQQANIIVGLGVLNECLCMSRLDDDKSGVEILVMKEYGVKESRTSLFLIRNLKINSSYGDVVPFFVTEAGEVALITEYNHRKKVVVFNLSLSR
ncbi:hypothetical protein P3S67_030011 [Capsicum chacoense]